jgi:hypothetical protein
MQAVFAGAVKTLSHFNRVVCQMINTLKKFYVNIKGIGECNHDHTDRESGNRLWRSLDTVRVVRLGSCISSRKGHTLSAARSPPAEVSQKKEKKSSGMQAAWMLTTTNRKSSLFEGPRRDGTGCTENLLAPKVGIASAVILNPKFEPWTGDPLIGYALWVRLKLEEPVGPVDRSARLTGRPG